MYLYMRLWKTFLGKSHLPEQEEKKMMGSFYKTWRLLYDYKNSSKFKRYIRGETCCNMYGTQWLESSIYLKTLT